MPVWPVYDRGILRLLAGAPIEVSDDAAGHRAALRKAEAFFMQAVKEDPSSWRHITSFLRRLNSA